MALGSYILDKGAVTFERHLLFRSQRKTFKMRVLLASLMLTSMVDMFSMLVCFMLQTFSSNPEVLVTKGIELPPSITSSIVKEAPLVSISAERRVYLDQKVVGTVAEVLKTPSLLTRPLRRLKQAWAKSHGGNAFPGEANLQAHRALSSAIISRIMGILTSQHYGSIQLAVTSGGHGSQ